MAVHTAEVAMVPNRRAGSLIAPREHGAWGLLLVPLFTGGIVGVLQGGEVFPLLALTIAALALFWLRTPAENWLGTGVMRAQTPRNLRAVARATLILSAVAFVAVVALVWNGKNRDLFLLGAIAIVAVLAQAVLRKLSRNTRMLSQFVGTLGLTVTAAAAYYVVTGQLNRIALTLWIANFLFAVNQIHFVQLRIHSARLNGWSQKFERGCGFLYGELLLTATLILAWRLHVLSGLETLAFLPLILRGAIWFFKKQKPLVVRRLGWTELAYAVVFGVCLVAGFRIGL
jgi:hypothetical protein